MSLIQLYRELFLFLWAHFGFLGALVGISALVSALCFPIYNLIGRIVEMENDLQDVLLPEISRIRSSCKDSAECQGAIERLYARFA